LHLNDGKMRHRRWPRVELQQSRPIAEVAPRRSKSGARRESSTTSSAVAALPGKSSTVEPQKRRQRLLKELEAGTARGSRELKPLDVLQRVQELIDMGEPLSNIRKVAKPRKTTVPDDAIVEVVEKLHKAYAFRPEVYRFVGIGEDVLRTAGVLTEDAARRGRARRKG
jgi:hypothetical protein